MKAAAVMGILLVKCPATEKEFSTGINAKENNLIGLRALVITSTSPHCGAEHAWRIDEARCVSNMEKKSRGELEVSLSGPDESRNQ